MTFSLGSFGVSLGFDGSAFTSGLNTAAAQTRIFGDTVTTGMTNPLLGTVGALKDVAQWLVRTAQETLSYAETIERVSASTGASVETLQALREALAQAGVDASTAEQGLAKFADVLGTARTTGGPAVATLDRLGISLNTLQPDDSGIRRVLEAVAAIEEPSKRAAAATDLFGRSAGPALANAISASGGSVEALVQEYKDLGLVLNGQSVQALAKLDDSVGRVTQSIEGLKRTAFSEFLQGLSPGLEDTSRRLSEVSGGLGDASTFARDLGAGLSVVLETINPVITGLKTLVTEIDNARNAAAELTAQAITNAPGLGDRVAADFSGIVSDLQETFAPNQTVGGALFGPSTARLRNRAFDLVDAFNEFQFRPSFNRRQRQ